MSWRPLAAVTLLLLPVAAGAEPELNGFDLAGASVPVEEILPGGPPRDGIPAIDKPGFETPEDADAWLRPDDYVIGVVRGDIRRAYPLRILNWHEVVNDRYEDEAIVVTYCPLCGTGIVFALPEPEAGGFGVSGLLYNSDLLLYDRKTESLWSQILGRAVTGKRLDEELVAIPARQTTWEQWRRLHPTTEVLSRATGAQRNYDHDPYAGYADSDSVFFPLRHRPPADGLHPKERVLGLVFEGAAKAYPFSSLASYNQSQFPDAIGGTDVVIHWDTTSGMAWATDAAGVELASVDGYWFAWHAFHPGTEVFAPPD